MYVYGRLKDSKFIESIDKKNMRFLTVPAGWEEISGSYQDYARFTNVYCVTFKLRINKDNIKKVFNGFLCAIAGISVWVAASLEIYDLASQRDKQMKP